ncbi:hypothetical protein TRFO_38456 [Tritrichomonas foetus]|uniref:Surface antigen BspA-like n=1 Tax=Tritrichomonas foetus TaxID=1144522 RepID=A0A1J4J8G3_9EUKA|nr:hypothetical protein TRFO_38456 [Tritrichomonas foetus]|eukprot:OHS95470.1 hypothetical protein TRFO_38456 [Tritrichomonas foetus]
MIFGKTERELWISKSFIIFRRYQNHFLILLTGTVIIPNSVTFIGVNAFYECSGLTGPLTIPNSVTEISSQAFYYCTGLSGNLTIGSNVELIGENAFFNCTELTNVIYLGTNPPEFEGNPFKYTNISSFYVDNTYTNDSFCGSPVSNISFYKVKIVNNTPTEVPLTYVDVDGSSLVLKQGETNFMLMQNFSIEVYVTYQLCNNTLLKDIQAVTGELTPFTISNEIINKKCSKIETSTDNEEPVKTNSDDKPVDTNSDDKPVDTTNDQNADAPDSTNVGMIAGIVVAVVVVIVVIIVVVVVVMKKKKHDSSSSLENYEINT